MSPKRKFQIDRSAINAKKNRYPVIGSSISEAHTKLEEGSLILRHMFATPGKLSNFMVFSEYISGPNNDNRVAEIVATRISGDETVTKTFNLRAGMKDANLTTPIKKGDRIIFSVGSLNADPNGGEKYISNLWISFTFITNARQGDIEEANE